MKIAVSLVIWREAGMLARCLSSLYESDAREHELRLYWHDNSAKNDGIVGPRVKLMQQILADGYEYALEIHQDMQFGLGFFAPLLESLELRPRAALAMPLSIEGRLATAEELADWERRQARDPRVVARTHHTFPWLIRTAAVREVGYYDRDFGAGRVEEPDLLYRLLKAGWDWIAVYASVVNHIGGGIRYKHPELLPMNENEQIFHAKHGLWPREFQSRLAPQPAVRLP